MKFASADRHILRTFALFVSLLAPAACSAVAIDFVATDLPDTTPGEDLWRYDYTVRDDTFLQSQFFDIYFDPVLYGAPVVAGPPPNPDWGVMVLQQPNPLNLPPFHVGMFDAAALVNDPSLTGTFSAEFVFLGQGNPGQQPFEVFSPAGEILVSGLTSSPSTVIPEPSTSILFVAGFIAVAMRRRANA